MHRVDQPIFTKRYMMSNTVTKQPTIFITVLILLYLTRSIFTFTLNPLLTEDNA